MRILGDVVIIESDKTTDKTVSGLVISKTKDPSDFFTGKVVYVGSGRITDGGMALFPDVKVGENVVFRYGTTIQLEGKSYLLVNSSDIIAVIN